MQLPLNCFDASFRSFERQVLRQNVRVARGFTPMSQVEMEALCTRVRDTAADGRFELYKTSMRDDGPPGRQQHGFPSDEKLTA